MAENETLDLCDRHSGRWRQLLQKFERNDPPESIADEVIRCIYATFKNLVELLPLQRLLDAAADDSSAIHNIVRECRKGREYAELIEQQSAIHKDPVRIIEGVARATIDKFLDQIVMMVVGGGRWPDMARFRVVREDVMKRVQKAISRLAHQVAENPNNKPRMPRRSAEQTKNAHCDMQSMSLLPRSGTHG